MKKAARAKSSEKGVLNGVRADVMRSHVGQRGRAGERAGAAQSGPRHGISATVAQTFSFDVKKLQTERIYYGRCVSCLPFASAQSNVLSLAIQS